MDHAASKLRNRTVAQLFERAADRYDQWSNPYTMHRRSTLLATHVVGRSVEIGGGTGAVTEQLTDRSRAFHSDISPRMCRIAINKLGRPSVCFDAESIPLADAVIDTAVSGEMIYYLEHPYRFIAEAHRVLRPGGRLVLSTTNATMTFLERGRTLLRRLGFSRMFFDDGSPSFIALDRLAEMLVHSGFTIELTYRIVVFPFASLDWLNRLLEQSFLARFGLFIVLVAKKSVAPNPALRPKLSLFESPPKIADERRRTRP